MNFWNRLFAKKPAAPTNKSEPDLLTPLLKALEDGEWYIRRDAAKALGELNDPRAIEPLTKVLRDMTERPGTDLVRRVASEAIGSLANHGVEQLIEAFTDNSDRADGIFACKAVVKALGLSGNPRAVEPLIKALSAVDPDIRWLAATALGKLRDGRAIEPLIKALGDEDRAVQGEVASALGALGDQRAVEPLATLMRSGPHPDVHREVVNALRKLGAPA